jgi:predicted MFS family arabinose efflux permease
MTGFDIGVASGSIIGGIAANFFGYAIMFYLAAIPSALALLVYFIKRGDSFAIGQQNCSYDVD